ncbi:hypothetical protein [Phycicoccus duodecadis]|uniref:Uncharacterized protein n=1 Tax=Phycicoccus duodecadis TaxID=173053 RepID=A0A2N3YMK8_9MICO|nr:hypothetical protein [Phycicoccus duodecadis]PKW28049.1 hypothetical protein ATL31_2904 [Phycicoccus duodecadis]
MSTPDGPAGHGRTVEYPPVVETLGRTYETDWSTSAHQEVKRVQNSLTSSQSFGQIPAAQDFAAVYRAAQHVYEATLQGIRTDLEAAGAALARAGAEIRQRDEASADTFQQLNAQWGDGSGFTSAQQHDQAEQQEPVREGAQAMQRLEGQPGAGPTDTTVTTEAGPTGPGPATSAGGTPPADDTMTTGGSPANG